MPDLSWLLSILGVVPSAYSTGSGRAVASCVRAALGGPRHWLVWSCSWSSALRLSRVSTAAVCRRCVAHASWGVRTVHGRFYLCDRRCCVSSVKPYGNVSAGAVCSLRCSEDGARAKSKRAQSLSKNSRRAADAQIRTVTDGHATYRTHGRTRLYLSIPNARLVSRRINARMPCA